VDFDELNDDVLVVVDQGIHVLNFELEDDDPVAQLGAGALDHHGSGAGFQHLGGGVHRRGRGEELHLGGGLDAPEGRHDQHDQHDQHAQHAQPEP